MDDFYIFVIVIGGLSLMMFVTGFILGYMWDKKETKENGTELNSDNEI